MNRANVRILIPSSRRLQVRDRSTAQVRPERAEDEKFRAILQQSCRPSMRFLGQFRRKFPAQRGTSPKLRIAIHDW
jgi:hypothetical protein